MVSANKDVNQKALERPALRINYAVVDKCSGTVLMRRHEENGRLELPYTERKIPDYRLDWYNLTRKAGSTTGVMQWQAGGILAEFYDDVIEKKSICLMLKRNGTSLIDLRENDVLVKLTDRVDNDECSLATLVHLEYIREEMGLPHRKLIPATSETGATRLPSLVNIWDTMGERTIVKVRVRAKE
jgi:hypothetical protein